MKKVSSAYYDGKSELDLYSINQILQTLVCLADSVWLNVGCGLSPEFPQQANKRLTELMEDLKDNGSLKLWGYPFQEEERRGGGITTIDPDRYREMADKINETFMMDGELLPKVSLTYHPSKRQSKGVETTSKLISVRKEYWSIAISDLLGVDRLIMDSDYRNMWLSCLSKIEYSKIEQQVVDHILHNLFRVPDLTNLNCGEILYLQKISTPLRERVARICENILIAFKYDIDVLRETNQLTEELLDFVDEKSKESGFDPLLKDTLYAIAGIFMPYISTLPLAKRFVDWLSTKRRFGYVLFTAELRRISRARHGVEDRTP